MYIFLVVPLGTSFPVASFLLSSVVVLIGLWAITILSAHPTITFMVVAILLGRVAGLTGAHVSSLQTTWLDAGTTLVTVIALTVLLAKCVFGPGRVTAHRIRGAIVLYLNVAVGFAAVYELAVTILPRAFSGVSFGASYPELRASLIYFSFTSITTTGFGDITPLHPFVRSIANLESVFGGLYPATLLARIVTLAMHDERQKA